MKSTLYAHQLWAQLLKPGDRVIDATCGNGHDTLVLAELVGPSGAVSAYDIQAEAIAATRTRTAALPQVTLHHRSHTSFLESSVKGIIYNLGYLPGGDKSCTTMAGSTLESLRQAVKILQPGGLISVMCYPGHPEGAREEQTLLEWAASLPADAWKCEHHRWVNRERSPSLLLISSIIKNDPQTTTIPS